MKYFYLLVLVCVSLNAQWRREDELIILNFNNRMTTIESFGNRFTESYNKCGRTLFDEKTNKVNANIIWQAFVLIKNIDVLHSEYDKDNRYMAYEKCKHPIDWRYQICDKTGNQVKKLNGHWHHFKNPIGEKFRALSTYDAFRLAKQIERESKQKYPKYWEHFENEWNKKYKK